MADLKQFSKNIVARSELVKRNMNKLIRTVALAIDQEVVVSTPVDTGRARSNWYATLGAPFEGELEPYFPYPSKTDPSKKGEGANAGAAIQQAQYAVFGRQDGQAVYITNNTPYIGKLNSEETRSSQAPPGFVQEAIKAGIRSLDGFKLTE